MIFFTGPNLSKEQIAYEHLNIWKQSVFANNWGKKANGVFNTYLW
jgi:hypothetical protein